MQLARREIGGTKQFESFHWAELKTVGLELGVGDKIKLLDLLVKKKGAWGTRLANLGCFLLYRREQSDPDSEFQDPDGEFEGYQERINQGLNLLEEDPCQNDLKQQGSLFTAHTDFVERKERISKSANLTAKVLHYFSGKISTSNHQECTIVNPSYHGVKDEFLHAVFLGDGADSALWKPGLPKIKRCIKPKVKHNGTLEMWIVTEIDYCDKFHIRGVQCTSTLVDGHTTVGTHAASRQSLGRNQIGFKAIRLSYDSQGELKKWRRNVMGNSLASLRGDQGGLIWEEGAVASTLRIWNCLGK